MAALHRTRLPILVVALPLLITFLPAALAGAHPAALDADPPTVSLSGFVNASLFTQNAFYGPGNGQSARYLELDQPVRQSARPRRSGAGRHTRRRPLERGLFGGAESVEEDGLDSGDRDRNIAGDAMLRYTAGLFGVGLNWTVTRTSWLDDDRARFSRTGHQIGLSTTFSF